MVCKICGEKHGRHGGYFNRHLKNKHNIENYVDYIVEVDYGGVRPVCKCGCGEYTTYHQNNFNEFVHGHNTQHRHSQSFLERPNEVIKDLYMSGKNGYEISNIVNLPLTYVYKVISKNGITRVMSDAKRVYTLDQTIFDKIDTEEKAYWLGFLFADGYNNETRGTVVLTLHNQDLDTLNKFTKFMNTNKPIGRNTDNSSKVVIESKHISKTLSKIGMIQKKTHVLEFPNIEKHLRKDFIRGYFDGDGCATYGKKIGYNITISIVSTKSFLFKILDEIKDIKFSLVKRHKDRDDNIYSITSGGVSNIIKFYYYLYDDSNIYMSRKKK